MSNWGFQLAVSTAVKREPMFNTKNMFCNFFLNINGVSSIDFPFMACMMVQLYAFGNAMLSLPSFDDFHQHLSPDSLEWSSPPLPAVELCCSYW